MPSTTTTTTTTTQTQTKTPHPKKRPRLRPRRPLTPLQIPPPPNSLPSTFYNPHHPTTPPPPPKTHHTPISSSYTRRGTHRHHNEDRVLADDTNYVYGIFDGHGGDSVAEGCVGLFRGLLLRGCFGLLMEDVFEKVERELFEGYNGENGGGRCCGSTATVLRRGRMGGLELGHCGDSRGVVVGEIGGVWKGVVLTRDHDCLDGGEVRRVRSEGGVVIGGRVGGVLGVTRSLGDWEVRGVSGKPDVVWCEGVEGVKAVVLGSDGVWDFVRVEDVVGVVRDWGKGMDGVGMAERIGELARRNGSTDDVSVVVVTDNAWK